MVKTKVTIHIVTPNVLGLNYDPARDGSVKSTQSKINVNKVTDGYSVVYDDNVFVTLSYPSLAASILKLFRANVKDGMFEFGIVYHYETMDRSFFDVGVAKCVLEMHDLMAKIAETGSLPDFVYVPTENIEETIDDFQYETETDEDPLSMFDGYDDDDDDDEEVDDEDRDWLEYLGDNRKKKKKNNKKTSDYYGRSRTWKNAKQPRKQIDRHGVIIASDKDDIRKDKKIIKAFLKDFIPGNSKWKRDFREDVLERWVSMYVISRKQLKQLERQHRKNRRQKNPATKRLLNSVENLFTVPIDHWSDPTR